MAIEVDIQGTEFAGAMKVRFADVEITNYDDTGETLAPADLGMYRFQQLVPMSSDATAVGFDISTDTLNVDVAAGGTASLRVMAVGR